MRRHLLSLTLVTAGFAGGALVALWAAPEPLPQGGRGGRGGPQGGLGLFQLFDTNGDLALSPAEMDAAPTVLAGRDQNRDGRVTLDELPVGGGRGGRGGFPGGGRGGRGRGEGAGEGAGPSSSAAADELVETLMAFDKNADQKLTRDEVPERMQGIFDTADADKNGQLTADEIRKSVAGQSQPGGEAPGGRPGGGPGGRFGRGEGGEGFGRPGGTGGRDPLSSALDSNADGVIDTAEVSSAPKAMRTLDRNGDGVVSLDEVGGGRGRGPEGTAL